MRIVFQSKRVPHTVCQLCQDRWVPLSLPTGFWNGDAANGKGLCSKEALEIYQDEVLLGTTHALYRVLGWRRKDPGGIAYL